MAVDFINIVESPDRQTRMITLRFAKPLGEER